VYFIVNTSNKDIVVSDMGLTIKVKQGLDLDNKNIKLLKSYNESGDLKIAIQKGLVKITGKNNKQKEEKKKEEKPSNDLDKIREIIKEELGKNKSNSSDNKILELLEKTNKLLEISPRQTINDNVIIIDKNNIEEENDINESTLNKIHAKRVNQLIKGSENNIRNENNETVDDPSISDNISELSNLL
jgi:hypothetical protein